jgi:casein kinase 1
MRKAKEDVKIDLQKNDGSGGINVIVVSSGSESNDTFPVQFQPSKAARLREISSRASRASDNQTLTTLVREFVEVLRMNSSRTLTREAFVFLDVLYKQLDNPSVFIQPARFVHFVYYVPSAMPDEKEILGHHENARLMNKHQRKSLLTLSWE